MLLGSTAYIYDHCLNFTNYKLDDTAKNESEILIFS